MGRFFYSSPPPPRWCPETKTCEPLTSNCTNKIKLIVNCPRLPDPAYAYNETFARYYMTPIVAAVFGDSPEPCLRAQLPHVAYYKNIRVNCSTDFPNVTCYGYTAWDSVEKAVIIAFEGTSSGYQMTDEILSFFQEKVAFFDDGHLFKYFHDAFISLWDGGLERQVHTLKYQYPDYKLYITGHSLGASIATVAASYIVKWGRWSPNDVRIVTFGQPRTGDIDFAEWHDGVFRYSYRIVHQRDPVPHIPPVLGKDSVFHHRFEVWYNNNMTVGQPYTICPEADGDYCSNKVISGEAWEHMWYFDKDLGDWGAKGCPSS
ncbi:hypothetical protein RB195_015477 [Necator americanus]|uniref:Fungal lipase-type domain-containing protein n=1 Tax=Necator americanus TaxID=51031 RepID=A0ABR1E4S2_NECAM